MSLVTMTLVTVGLSSRADAAATLKIPGNFTYVSSIVDGGRCNWGIGVEFPSVPKAISYSITYYDGYYHSLEYGSVPAPVPKSNRAGSLNYFGITGGEGPGPCVADVTEGGRFTKKPVVTANFMGKAPSLGAISGMVTDKDGNPVGGVKVTSYGPSHESVESGPGGLYFMMVKKGSYRVVPDATGLKGTTVSPSSKDVSVAPHETATANFVADGGLTVSLSFTKYSAPANGLEVVQGKLETTKFGKPAPGINVSLTVDETDIAASLTTDPKVVVCGSSGRVWPSGPNITDLSDVPVTVTTDAKGDFDFSLTVGTRPGKWSLDAWAKNEDGSLSTDVSRASETKVLDLTSLTPTLSVNDFLTEMNLIKSTSFSQSLTPSNPGAFQALLSQLAATPSQGLKFGGLDYSLVQGNDGYALVISPLTTQFTVESTGEIKLTGPVLSSLIIDPSEWTGASLPAKLGNVASIDVMAQAGAIPDIPTVAQWIKGSSLPSWKLPGQKSMNIVTNSLANYGWAYYPPATWPTGYCN